MMDRPQAAWRWARRAPVFGAIGFVLLVSSCAALADVISSRPVTADASLFALLVHGARSTLVIVVIATSLSLAAGLGLGAVAGFSGGSWDRSIARLIELVAAFPTVIVVAIVYSAVEQPGLATVGVAIALVRLSEVARLVRLEVIAWRSSEQALAARAIGATMRGMLLWHLGPRLAVVLAQTAVSSVSAVIVIETLMEFVGLGTARTAPTWGATLARAVAAGHNGAAVAVLAASVLTVASAQILAEHVRESFDPHPRRATPCTPRA